jgi:hypothetical protein
VVAIGVYDECGEIVRSVVRPEARQPIVNAAVSNGSLVKIEDGSPTCRGEGEMKARTGRALSFRTELDCKFVAPPGIP